MAEEKEEWTYAGKPKEYWKGYPTAGEIVAFEIWLERRERMKDRIAYIIIALIVSVIFAVASILSANIRIADVNNTGERADIVSHSHMA